MNKNIFAENHTPSAANIQPDDIDGKLVTSLRDISHTMRSLYEGRGSQRRILIILNEAGTITQRELTMRLGIQPGSASEVIAKLENLGLITRSPSETDRRTIDISLTEKGKTQADAALQQHRQRQGEMFFALSEDEKNQLLALLEKINNDWKNRYHTGREHAHDFDHRRGHGRFHGHDSDSEYRGERRNRGGFEFRGAHGHSGGFERGSGYGHGDGFQHDSGYGHGNAFKHGHGYGDDSGRGTEQNGKRGCSHDCQNCPHPCGKGLYN